MRVARGGEAGHVDEGHGDLALGLRQRGAHAEQQAVGAEQLRRFGDGEGEGGAVIGDGAGDGRGQIGQLEQTQAGAAEVVRAAQDEGVDRRGPLIGADRGERFGQRLLSRLADEVRQQAAAPGLGDRTARTGARAERHVDAAVSVKLEQGVGGGEGHSEQTRFGIHAYRLPEGNEDRLDEDD